MSQDRQRVVVVGTRGSDLAMTQTRQVVGMLSAQYPSHSFDVKIVTTSGDRNASPQVAEIGTGIFTREIERGLLNRTLDMAVHSLKDLPTTQPEGLAIAAVLKREDPRDALISRGGLALADLPQGARIGTGSIRRAAQLRAYRADLQMVSIRGNVPTRLQKLESMNLDAIILAAAGLKRLGRDAAITEYIDPEIMVPAAGQGIVAVEARSRDNETVDIVRCLEDEVARTESLAERHLLELLGGGCQAPVGAFARVAEGRVMLSAVVVTPDGGRALKASAEGEPSEWRDVTWQVAKELRNGGAEDILREARH